MKLSLIQPAGATPPAADPALEAFPGTWERCPPGAEAPDSAAPAEAKNRLWRGAQGAWVLFAGAGPLPTLACFSAALDADLVCPGPPPKEDEALILRTPFAVRRAFLEALDGFREMPGGVEDFELGLRAMEAGARILPNTAWKGSAPAGPLDYGTVLALLVRHPGEAVLRWACGPGSRDELPARFAERYGRPLPSQDRFSLPELAGHFAERSAPPLLPAEEITRLLEGASAAELWSTGTGTGRRMDRSHAANWLMANTVCFEAMAARNLCLRFPPPRLVAGANAEPGPEPLGISLEGRYEVTVERAALAGLRPSSLTLPLPLPGPEQQDLELFDFEPADLDERLDAEGATATLPVPGDARTAFRIGYSFRCTVREGVGVPATEVPPMPVIPLAPAYAAQVDGILASLFDSGGADLTPRHRARRIYDWIRDNVVFRLSERAGLFALDARAGNCAHRVRLFTLLCSRASVAVRERSGVLAGDLQSHGLHEGRRWATTERCDRGHPLFHVWADVFLGDEGWVPVDFLGADSGARMMTPRNVRDPRVRAELHAWTPRLEDYYFGRVDPYRLHFGPRPKALSGIPDGVPGGGLEAIWRAAWGTRHALRTRLTGLPPHHPREEKG